MKYFAFLFTYFFSILVFSQSEVPKETIEKYKKSGEKHFEMGDYNIAMKEFATIIQMYINDPEINYKYATSILKANYHKEQAIPFFETAINSGNIEAVKMLGLTYHEMYKFDEAIEQYKKYISLVDTNSKKYKNSDIKLLIINSLNAKEFVLSPKDVTIENIGDKVNSEFADYAPVVTADDQEIFFTSKRANSTGGNFDHNAEYFEDIFYSIKDSLGNWSYCKHLSENLNSHHHDAVAGISADGQTLIVYRNDIYGHGGDLYISYLEDTSWSEPKILTEEISKKDCWEPSASLTANEDAIYFSSDRIGGYGGLDLYMAKRLSNGSYGNVVNLGPQINTPYDEDAPFIDADGKNLYFSSKGHKNMGGFDVFKSERNIKGDWETPQNMGYPINTTDDDIYFTINAEGTHGYYASLGVDSYGEKDIYMIKFKPKVKTIAILKGKVTDYKNKSIASQIFVNKVGNTKLNGLYNSNAITGKYMMVLQPGENYRAIFKADGYVNDTLFVNAKEFEGFKEVIKNIKLKKIKEILPDSVVQNTKEDIVIGKEEKIQPIAVTLPQDSTKKQTIIDTNGNIVVKNQPLVENKNIKPLEINLEEKPTKKQIKFTPNCEIDFSDSVHILSFNFGYKKMDLTTKQYHALDSILKPYIKNIKGIKLNTHTDNLGSVRYNMTLSQGRAKKVSNYLKNIGLTNKKIIACFYGESKPLEPNQFEDGSDNPDGRYKNRRVEIEFFINK